MNNICERYRFASLEEVYAAVGYGGVSINQIMFKLLNINNVQTASDEQENRARVLRKSGKGNMVEIKGYDDFLVRFALLFSRAWRRNCRVYKPRSRRVSAQG
ncbi:MAG: hypothetical protein ACLUG1_00720 [Christensenellales bacterium]